MLYGADALYSVLGTRHLNNNEYMNIHNELIVVLTKSTFAMSWKLEMKPAE